MKSGRDNLERMDINLILLSSIIATTFVYFTHSSLIKKKKQFNLLILHLKYLIFALNTKKEHVLGPYL